MMAVEDTQECPLCMENLDIDDKSFFPCTCGYQICRFCWHRIRVNENGLCPACRKPYPENPANFKPLSVEDLQKMKAQKRQKDQLKKQKTVDNRRHLADLRVVQKNLVFVVGIAQRIADPEMLKKPEYFGKFGKIQKIVVNPCLQGSSAGAYITYYKSEDALRAIQSVNNVPFDGRTIKASLGTTKYCSHFMRNQQCPKSECMYLHHYGDPEASFTKEDMQLGKHQEYEKKLIEDFVQQMSSGSVSIKKPQKERTNSGGSIGDLTTAVTPLNSFKDTNNTWNNGTSNSSSNDFDIQVDEALSVPEEQESSDDIPVGIPDDVRENHPVELLEEHLPTTGSNFQDDDLGFDPFHETQKAFEELIQEEVNNQRINYHAFSHTGDPSSVQQSHALPAHMLHGHSQIQHLRPTVLDQQHSTMRHASSQPPPSHMNSSSVFPRTLLPPPGFNSGLIQSNSQQAVAPQAQQVLHQQNNHNFHRWTNAVGSGTGSSHHLGHPQFKPSQITLKEMEDWMSLDPAIIFSSSHLRPQASLGQPSQTAPPGFSALNGHIKSRPQY